LQDPTEKHFGDVGILDKYEDNNNNVVLDPNAFQFIILFCLTPDNFTHQGGHQLFR
jgi:hypothetical protein